MAVKTYLQQLEEVQAAIGAIESGSQSYTVGGRSLTRGDLKTLYDREKFLRIQVERDTNKGLKVQYVVPE